jgi:hypothetical protein
MNAPLQGSIKQSPGDQAAQTESGRGAGALLNADRAYAANFGTRITILRKALDGLQNTTTGPRTDVMNNIKSFLLAQGPDILQKMGIVDPSKIQSYDEANKYLTQYAMAQSGSMGEGTDAKLATAIAGNANTHISNLASQDVVKTNIALELMNNAALQEFDKSNLLESQWPKFKSNFGSNIDPRVFLWGSMPMDKRSAAASKMTADQREQFKNQYNWAISNGYIDK